MTNKLVGFIGRRGLVGGAVIAGAVTVFVASTQGVLADGQSSQPSSTSTTTTLQPTSAQMTLVTQKFGFLDTKSLWSQFTSVNGTLALKTPIATLQGEDSLTTAQVESVQSILTFAAQAAAEGASIEKSAAAGVASPIFGSAVGTPAAVADFVRSAYNKPFVSVDAAYKPAPAQARKASLDLSVSNWRI